MLTLRNSGVLLKIYNHAVRRRDSYWRIRAAVGSECQGHAMTAMRRSFSRSPVSSCAAEHTEDALPDEITELRSRMSKLHNVVSSKGVSLADYKRSSSEDEEDESNSASLQEVNSESDHLGGSPEQMNSTPDGLGKGLRKEKDVDVVINMPYGHVRFDSMNRQKSALQRASDDSNVALDDIPSVNILQDGKHVFSLSPVEENETDLENAAVDASDEICSTRNQTLSSLSSPSSFDEIKECEVRDMKSHLFDEQYINDILQQEEVKQGNLSRDPATNGNMCNPRTIFFDELYCSEVLQHEQQQTSSEQEKDKEVNLAENVITNSDVFRPNLFDAQYFGNVLHRDEQKQTDITTSCDKVLSDVMRNSQTVDMKPNLFDEQYFGDVLQEEKQQRNGQVEDVCKQNRLSDIEKYASDLKSASVNDEQLSVIDEQYFGSYVQSKLAPSQKAQENDGGKGDFVTSGQTEDSHHSLEADSSCRLWQCSSQPKLNEIVDAPTDDNAFIGKELENTFQDSLTDDDNPVVVEPIIRREMRSRTRPQADIESPKTAYDLAMKIRREKQQKESTDTDKNQPTSTNGYNSVYNNHCPFTIYCIVFL